MRRLLRLCLPLVAALVLFSCVKAFSKLAYNNLLPKIILQRIDFYFDLNSDQRSRLIAQIALHHQWHRNSQLKLYLADLRDLRQRFAARLKPADLDWLTGRLTLHRNAIFARVIPDLAQVLQTLSPDQISNLEKKLAKENKELATKLARPQAVRQEEEFGLIVEQVESWAGSITDAQKTELRARYSAIPAAANDWLRYRENQQAVWIALLRSKPDYQRLKDDLDGRMLYQEKNVPKQFRASFARTLTLMKEMILTADKMLTAEQRAHVLKKTDEYIQLLADLAA